MKEPIEVLMEARGVELAPRPDKLVEKRPNLCYNCKEFASPEEGGMEHSLDELWISLGMAWSTLKTLISGHPWQAAAFVAIIIIFWIFLSPGIKRK
ncbi:MAG: hypothetical protein WCF59_14470 [Desulfobaccales bacterium]